MLEIIPGIGITSKTLEEIERKVDLVAPYVDWIQIDIADNTLFENETFLDVEKLKPLIDRTGKSFEAHLLVANPEKYIHALVDAGFQRIIAHVECDDPRRFLEVMQAESVEVGLALDGPTELEALEPFLEGLDVVLIMTIEAGFSGQPFLPETLEKIKTLRQHGVDVPIEVDGGINDQTVRLVKEAGATRAAVTSYLFKQEDNIEEAINGLKSV